MRRGRWTQNRIKYFGVGRFACSPCEPVIVFSNIPDQGRDQGHGVSRMAKGRAKKWLLWSGIAGALALVLLLAVAVPTGSLEEPLFSIGPGMTEEEEGR